MIQEATANLQQINTPNEILEEKVTKLLESYAKDAYAKERVAKHIAKKSLELNHLYQDLGFKNRKAMNAYMKEHFPTLAAQKPVDKLWKKYIYELVGETAPACFTCSDQVNCFVCKI